MMDMMNNGGAWMDGIWLLSLLFWILLIAGVVLVVMWLVQRNRSLPPPESAVDILGKRYARGEIDRETFERMRRDIEGQGS